MPNSFYHARLRFARVGFNATIGGIIKREHNERKRGVEFCTDEEVFGTQYSHHTHKRSSSSNSSIWLQNSLQCAYICGHLHKKRKQQQDARKGTVIRSHTHKQRHPTRQEKGSGAVFLKMFLWIIASSAQGRGETTSTTINTHMRCLNLHLVLTSINWQQNISLSLSLSFFLRDSGATSTCHTLHRKRAYIAHSQFRKQQQLLPDL